MNNAYKYNKKLSKWDINKTLFQNGELLEVTYGQADNIAKKYKLEYKKEELIGRTARHKRNFNEQ